ncbi:maf-like protein FUAG_01541 [Clostridium sp. CAG:307]|nr:maf-like protein FUAG_01541 [Clostridium sp. CAG:307]
MKLILASKSPRRKEILQREGFTFEIVSKNTDETMDANLSPYQNVMNVARKKGEAVASLFPNEVVLSTDTIVCLDGKIYGKPKDRKDAYNTLATFSGMTHEVVSGVSIISKKLNMTMYVKSYVTFKKLTKEMIDDYLKTDEPYDKAGSYAIQGEGRSLIEGYSGSLDNIIGLPIEYIKDMLRVMLNEVENR